jgi:hypothetical protein
MSIDFVSILAPTFVGENFCRRGGGYRKRKSLQLKLLLRGRKCRLGHLHITQKYFRDATQKGTMMI